MLIFFGSSTAPITVLARRKSVPDWSEQSMEEQIRFILKALGENPDREGLQRTPQRVAEALTFLTQGYQMDPAKVINDAVFSEDYEEMIVQKDIDFYSLCEHHLMPFFG